MTEAEELARLFFQTHEDFAPDYGFYPPNAIGRTWDLLPNSHQKLLINVFECLTPRIRSIMGRKGGRIGGVERAKRLTPEQRTVTARKAANARWGNKC